MTEQNTIDGAFRTLSDIQHEAASWRDGALMLLAGPGSGKTRVLTSRVAQLFANEPAAKWRILALTFTTRAADEMRNRIEQLAPNAVERLYVGTFHSFACEILRQSGSHVGVQTDFKIYSSPGDRELLLAEALRAADVNLGEPLSKAFPVLDGLRDRLAGPDNCLRFFRSSRSGHSVCSGLSSLRRPSRSRKCSRFSCHPLHGAQAIHRFSAHRRAVSPDLPIY